VHPVPVPVIAPQWVDVSPMDQLQFGPGSIPEASTSDTNAATEGRVTEGTGTTGAVCATVGMTIAGGVVAGVVTVDVVVVVTTRGATAAVLAVVFSDRGALTMGMVAGRDPGPAARAVGWLLETPTDAPAPMTNAATMATAFQRRETRLGVRRRHRPTRDRCRLSVSERGRFE
jgi:hypothetical protein